MRPTHKCNGGHTIPSLHCNYFILSSVCIPHSTQLRSSTLTQLSYSIRIQIETDRQTDNIISFAKSTIDLLKTARPVLASYNNTSSELYCRLINGGDDIAGVLVNSTSRCWLQAVSLPLYQLQNASWDGINLPD